MKLTRKCEAKRKIRSRKAKEFPKSERHAARLRKTAEKSLKIEYAGMAELADALDSGSSSSNIVQVQVLLPAPKQYNPNQIFPVGDGFGLFVYFEKFEDTHFKNGIIKRPNSKPRGPRKKKQS